LTEAIRMPDLRDDSRFITREKRIDNYESLAPIVESALKTKSRNYWLQEMERHDVPCTPIYDMSEVFDDPQLKHLGLEVEYQHPTEGTTKSVRPAITLSRTELEKASPPPALARRRRRSAPPSRAGYRG
jgi:crotonobetainyl-CoA:carnitine CoA-transferase CaiB-like acyl-CoA transferase